MVIISNLGQRDMQLKAPVSLPEPLRLSRPTELWVRGEKEEEVCAFKAGPLPQGAMRELGAYVLEHYKLFREVIWFPILDSVVQYALEELRETNESIQAIVLVSTDQMDDTKKWTDTLFVGKVFKQHYVNDLKARYSGNDELYNLICDAKVDVYNYTYNPTEYDSANEFFEDKLARLGQKYGDTRYLINVTGGTQQMNSMLLLNALRTLPNPDRVCYVYKPENGTPIPLAYGKTALRRETTAAILTVLSASDYAAAERLLKENQKRFDDYGFVSLMTNLLQFAQSRASYDFRAAKSALDKARGYANAQERDRIARWRQSIEALLGEGADAERLAELIDNMRLQLVRREYIGFLGRVFRYYEEVLRCLAISLGVEVAKGGFVKSWVTRNPSVEEYLRRKGTNFDLAANRRVYSDLIECLAAPGSRQREAFDRLKKLEKLANLRNNIVITHGFDGVSLKIMCENYDPSISPEDFPERVMEHIEDVYRRTFPDASPPTRVFDGINEALIQIVQSRTGLR
jgi:hypothetical protein